MSSLADGYQRWRDERERTPVDIAVTTVPAWVFRIVLCVVIFVGGLVTQGEWIAPLVAAVILACVPHFGLFALMVAASVASALWREPDLVATSVLALALHAAYALVGLVQDLPLDGGVEVRLVLRAGLAFGIIQLIAQVLVVLAFASRGVVTSMPWVTVVALAVLVVGVALALRWLARNEGDVRPWIK